MNQQSEDMRRELDDIFSAFPHIHTTDIPGIDLYMDQVTTFLHENLQGLSRDPDGDKFLTKTMINNYVKNKVLIPPVKKKYSRDHMMLLIMIYYMKSFLSIGDIRTITAPVMERYAETPADPKKEMKKDAKKEAADRKREAALRKKEAAERRREGEKGNTSGTADDSSNSRNHDTEGTSGTQDLKIYDIYEAIISDLEAQLPDIQDDIERSIEMSEGIFADVPREDRPLLQRFALICKLSAEVYMRKLFIEKLLDAETGVDGQPS